MNPTKTATQPFQNQEGAGGTDCHHTWSQGRLVSGTKMQYAGSKSDKSEDKSDLTNGRLKRIETILKTSVLENDWIWKLS